MSLQQYLKERGHIHLLWLIVVLLLVIAAQLIMRPGGETVNIFISFASSLASLILAIVAIFYSIITNQNFSGSISKIETASTDLHQTTKVVQSSLLDFSMKMDELRSDVSQVPGSVEQIREHMMEQLNEMLPKGASYLNMHSQHPSISDKSMSKGLAVGLYLFKRIALGERNFNMNDVDWDDQYGEAIALGVLSSIAYFEPFGTRMNQVGTSFSVDIVGAFDLEAIDQVSGTDDEFVLDKKKRIDAAFEELR